MFRRDLIAMIVAVASLSASIQSSAKESQLQYPETRRIDQVDTFHGVEVADPYRWLEDDVRTSTEVAAWVDSQNQVTRAYLDAIKQRAAIHQRLTKLWNYETMANGMVEEAYKRQWIM